MIAVIAVIAAVAVFASGMLTGGDQTQVPNVIGQAQEEAVSAIEDAGFKVGDITPNYSDEFDEGEVMDQTPQGGSMEAKGTEIDIVISRGPQPI